MIRHRRLWDPRRMDGVDRDDFLTVARPTTEPSSHILLVRSTLYSELSDYGHHSRFAVHHPDFTFESGVYVRPVIYRGSDNVYGDSSYCVYLWGRTVTEHRWYCSTPPDLCTRSDSLNIVGAPLPCSLHKLFILWSVLLTHFCTDKFSLYHHLELPMDIENPYRLSNCLYR